MSKRERVTKDDEGGGEKRMKIDNDPEILNALESWKRTALHKAAHNGHADVAKVLLENDAEVNAVLKDK